jgi:hypothetical protein
VIIDVGAPLEVGADFVTVFVDADVDCSWDEAGDSISDKVEEEGCTTVPIVGAGVTVEVGEVDGSDLDLIVDEDAVVDVTDTEDPILLGELKSKVVDTQRVDL